ncbi:tRNA (cytidine(34)-2'-O)-methyltransferase [Sphingobium boeckii]|uniref:tRNA (cytidine(34)-2'-O)-methyltransferase n=1 Tax=Sphingobium boeckii TaxID=1082345 RepID=A0A7W9AK01_9SPHN|nr:tRNA (cytidine(34)-2'-O)-methyltransferase [Sphingobium boeckii]MBB5687045.1 tRNA (cytidine/uridine-2'-O-)-methyltransferase [Sphingobium boeckii]
MRIALYQPEIAGNVGAILRLSACYGVPVDIIEPCGFAFSDKRLARAGMDYAVEAEIMRHASWADFQAQRTGRLVLMTTKGAERLHDARFAPDDILLMGSEGSGVPEAVHAGVDLRIKIPLRAGFRSLNVGMAAGIALTEALRQTGGLPE